MGEAASEAMRAISEIMRAMREEATRVNEERAAAAHHRQPLEPPASDAK